MAKRAGARSRDNNKTRYERVKDILNAAVAGSSADYGGAGQFWDGNVDEFKQVSVFDIRMIAPAGEASCCGGGETRSARSGLIRGLRGEAPFDNGRFPPLMWGGKPVAEPDIEFIADWIDDGCPADDHLQTIDAGPLEGKAGKPVKLSEVAEFEAFATGAKRYAYREGEPRHASSRAKVPAAADCRS